MALKFQFEGVDEELQEEIIKQGNKAYEDGFFYFQLWMKVLEIKATVTAVGDTLVIRKED